MRHWLVAKRSLPAAFLHIALATLLVACGGGYPEPHNQLTASEAAVRAAEVAGAQNSPQSALHLKRAREQVDSGKGLIQEGENERAEWVFASTPNGLSAESHAKFEEFALVLTRELALTGRTLVSSTRVGAR